MCKVVPLPVINKVKPFKCPYKWITGVITPVNGVITLLINDFPGMISSQPDGEASEVFPVPFVFLVLSMVAGRYSLGFV